MRRVARWFWIFAIAGVILLGVSAAGLWWAIGRGSRGGQGRQADRPGFPRLVLLDPGTPVAGAIPEGWTSRVIRSVPRLASGELSSLPGSAKTAAGLPRTVILARVSRATAVGGGEDESRPYRLDAVGVGNAVPFEGREVVVTPDGPPEVRAALTTVQRLIVGAADNELRRGVIAAGTPTFALFRTPARQVIGGQHVAVVLSYALLVDPEAGTVRTLAWSVPAGTTTPPGRIVELGPDALSDCAVDVRVKTRVGPIPVAWSVAMLAPPEGRPVEVPADSEAARAIEATAQGRDDPALLERALRGLLGTGAAR